MKEERSDQAKMTIFDSLPEPVDPTERMQQRSHSLDLAWLTVRKGDLSETDRPAITPQFLFFIFQNKKLPF